MVYTLGYEGLSAERLVAIAKHLDADVIDVRGVPHSRKRGFGSKQLPAALGDRYQWHGDKLGNKGENRVTLEGLDRVIDWSLSGRNKILMCLEEAPADCHRFQLIARPLLDRGVDTLNIFQDELIATSSLIEALNSTDPDAAYEYEPFSLPGGP